MRPRSAARNCFPPAVNISAGLSGQTVSCCPIWLKTSLQRAMWSPPIDHTDQPIRTKKAAFGLDPLVNRSIDQKFVLGELAARPVKTATSSKVSPPEQCGPSSLFHGRYGASSKAPVARHAGRVDYTGWPARHARRSTERQCDTPQRAARSAQSRPFVAFGTMG